MPSGSGWISGQKIQDPTQVNFAGNSGGLIDAKNYASSGGVVQQGPGTEGIGPGTYSLVVSLVRVTATGLWVIKGLRVVDGTTPTKAATFDVSAITTATTRTVTIPNWSGTMPLPSGPGISGQFLKSTGAGTAPIWDWVVRRYLFMAPNQWAGNSDQVITAGTGAFGQYPFSGIANNNIARQFTVPGDFSSLVSWTLIFANGLAVDTADLTWRLGLKKFTVDGDAGGSNTTSDTTVAGMSGIRTMKFVTLTPPSISMTAGDVFDVEITRLGLTDTHAQTVGFLGLLMTYLVP